MSNKREVSQETPLEVEAKFIITSAITVGRVEQALEELGLKPKWQAPLQHHDLYLDTADGWLRRQESALRVRRIGQRWTCTFKRRAGPAEGGAVFVRSEFQWELAPEEAQNFEEGGNLKLPQELSLPFESDRLLRVLTVDTRRSVALLKGEGELEIELALDETVFRGPRGEADHRELELELKRGEPQQLQTVALALQERLQLEPSRSSKYALGMERVG